MTTPPVTPPPLDIQQYHVHELVFRALDEYDAEQPSSGEIDVDFDVQRSADDLHHFRINMRVKIAARGYVAEENSPYTISLLIVGYFTFFEGTPEETMQHMIHLNGSSILYGIARGLVGQATGASIHGQFVLPAVNFVALNKSLADQRTALEPAPEHPTVEAGAEA